MSIVNEAEIEPPRSKTVEDFSFLGLGGKQDRLNFRMIMHIFRRSFPYLRPVFRHILGYIGLTVAIALYGLGIGFMSAQLSYASIMQGLPVSEATAWLLRLDPEIYVNVERLTEENRLALRWWAAFLVGALAPSVAGGSAIGYYQVWILQQINQALRVQLIERIQTMSMRFHTQTKIGDAIYRVYQDSAMVTSVMQYLIIDPIRILSLTLFAAVVATLFDPVLLLVILLVTCFALILGVLFSPRLRVGFRTMRETNSELTSQIQESIAGIKVIKACGAEEAYQEKFEARSRAAFSAAFSARFRLALYGMLAFFVVVGGVCLGEARLASLTAGEAVVWGAFILAVFGFAKFNMGTYTSARERMGEGLWNIEIISGAWGRLQDMAIGLDRVFDILDLQVEVQDGPDAVDMPNFEESITYEHVVFGYRSDNTIVEDVTFEARAGQITALVGPTGSGKTTLVTLLLHLYELNGGAIRIDGLNINRIKLDSLRRNISIALQENILFGTTVKENIRYAVPSASDEEVAEAARIACADAFIRELPQGYDTLLGERGAKLSTGQRQRLSIARAIIKDAPILILDEPTAALDAETELKVIENLAEWGQGRVILVITHRLSTIRSADQIACLRDGKIVEAGSHADLMERDGGTYRKLVNMEDAGLKTSGTTAGEVS